MSPVHRSHSRPTPAPARPDELPAFVPDPEPVPAGPGERDALGRFVRGNKSSKVGGRRKRQVAQHLHSLGLEWLEGKPELAALRRRGNRQLKAEQQWVAGTVGGGVLDPLAAAELRNAVTKETLAQLMLESPKMVGSLRETITLADKLLTAARGHRLTALELSARGAEARSGSGNAPRLDIGSIDVTAELAALMAAGSPHNAAPNDDEDTDDDE